MRTPARPPLDGLKKRLDRSRAERERMPRDGFLRETFGAVVPELCRVRLREGAVVGVLTIAKVAIERSLSTLSRAACCPDISKPSCLFKRVDGRVINRNGP